MEKKLTIYLIAFFGLIFIGFLIVNIMHDIPSKPKLNPNDFRVKFSEIEYDTLPRSLAFQDSGKNYSLDSFVWTKGYWGTYAHYSNENSSGITQQVTNSEEGKLYVRSTVVIHSKQSKNRLTPIFLYYFDGERLRYLKTFSYDFNSVENLGYPTRLDAHNDFRKTQKIQFNLVAYIDEEYLTEYPLYVVGSRIGRYCLITEDSINVKDYTTPQSSWRVLEPSDINGNGFFIIDKVKK